jgi:hypothetical protein
VFFINLPIGILAFAGVFLFLSEKKSAEKRGSTCWASPAWPWPSAASR